MREVEEEDAEELESKGHMAGRRGGAEGGGMGRREVFGFVWKRVEEKERAAAIGRRVVNQQNIARFSLLPAPLTPLKGTALSSSGLECG